MKKVFIAFFALALSSGAFAQNSTSTSNSTSQVQLMQNKNGVVMKNGKVWERKNGKVSVLTQILYWLTEPL